MQSFWLEYGMFAAKIVTILGILVVALITIGSLLALRQRDRESIEIEKLNDKFDSMRDALESEIFSKDELKALKKERKKEEKEKNKTLKKKTLAAENENQRNRVFVVRFQGDMHASEVDHLRESITAILSVATREDEVLIILDSPGGIVHNYGLAASQLSRIRQKKIPLVVAIDLIAASGGYLMAVVANKILAAPFAIVGSIGVRAELPNFNRLLKKHDIDVEQHTAGEYKRTLTMFGENTDKAREKFKQELQDTHDLFKDFVKENRPQLDMEKIATGEYWHGLQSEALGLKLVDVLITSDDYLLEKSANADIFEVTYTIHQSLSDKVSGWIHGITLRITQSFFKTPL